MSTDELFLTLNVAVLQDVTGHSAGESLSKGYKGGVEVV